MRRCISIVALAACVGLAPLGAAADEAYKRELAKTIVTNPDVATERESMSWMMADIVARGIFEKLNRDPDWRADSQRWQQLYPEFFDGFRKVLDAYLGDVPQALEQRLVQSIDEPGLEEVVATRTEPKFVDLMARLRTKSLDTATALRLPDMAAHPRRYTEKEDEIARSIVESTLKDPKVIALNKELEAIKGRMMTPALSAYREAFAQVVYMRIDGFTADPKARPTLEPYLRGWFQRLNAR